MPLTKATQNVIAPNICTTDTAQNIFQQKTFPRLYAIKSFSNVSIGTGTKTFVVSGVTPSNLMWQTGDPIRVQRDTSRWMTGTVISFTPATNTIVINITATSQGIGQFYQNWDITYNGQITKSIVHQGDGTPFTVENSEGIMQSQIRSDGFFKAKGIEGSISDGFEQCVINGQKFYSTFLSTGSPNEQLILNPLPLSVDTGYEVFVRVYFSSFNSDTFVSTYDIGLYRDIFVVRKIENAQFYTGYQINAVASNTLFPIWTSVGRAVSGGGWSTTRYPCAFRATQPTTSADGTFSMEIKGHSTADTATIFYTSEVAVTIREVVF